MPEMETTGGVSRRWALKAAGAAGAAAILTSAGVDAAHADDAQGGARSRTQPRRRAGRRHLEDVGAQIRQGDLGATAAKGAGGQTRPRRGGEGRSGPHGRDARRDLVLGHGIARVPLEPDRRADAHRQPGTRHVPGITYLNLAIYDATIAAWAWKQHYRRRRPSDHRLKTAIDTPNSPSYPSEHGAAAGAAVGVLSHLYPDQAAQLAERAAAHAASRVAAGVEHPSDFKAGYALGKAVAAKVASRRIDVRRVRRALPGRPERAIPRRRRLVPGSAEGRRLPNHDQQVEAARDRRRHGVPANAAPAKASHERTVELAEVKNYPRRQQPDFAELFYWPQDPAGRPEPDSGAFLNAAQVAFYYAVDVELIVLEDINQKIHEYKLDTNPPRAARTYALVYATLLDAYIACWDAKYYYLVGRPAHFDPTIDTLWTTYPLASYPSGHACDLTAMATVLGYLFPRDEHYFLSRAKENAASRMWAGIHFRSDFVEGVAMGEEVGKAVIEYAKADGSS